MIPEISMMVHALFFAFAPGLIGALAAEVNVPVADYRQLNGWQENYNQFALWTFLKTCSDMKPEDWRSLCALAVNQKNPKLFLELFFWPVLISNGTPGLITGYFEPEIDGSRQPNSWFRYPVYKLPLNLPKNSSWFTRREIENQDGLANRGLEIARVDEPVELFFLQIQVFGRVGPPNGGVIRLGYGGFNGRRYKSIGTELVRRDIYQKYQVSALVIQNWVKRNMVACQKLLRHSSGFVFFRETSNFSAHNRPLGAMNRSITALCSLAVDPKYVPLGAPVWLEKQGGTRMNCLMTAQNTGSAIKGAQWGALFLGAGDTAGRVAGGFKDAGRMFVLMPIQRAYASAMEPSR